MRYANARSLAASVLLLAGAAQAQTLNADWLYFSPMGSWVEKTESILAAETQFQLPVESLSADQFYWAASNTNGQLTWTQPDPLGLPQTGSPVAIEGESGLWLVKNVSASHLVLQQGKNVRYWPQSQWHLLSWTSASDYGLSLSFLQPEKTKGTLFYAWQTPELTAQVRYRLDETGDEPVLVQELVLSNSGQSDYQAEGYSYAGSAQRPVVAMRTMMMSESADALISAPEASQSQGVPTLVSEEPLNIAASSQVWLPVSQTELSSVERRYQLYWDTRQQGMQQTTMSLALSSPNGLPDIPGPIAVGVFDRQIALMNSQYAPTNANEASLALGQSALVSMESRQSRAGNWVLEFSNRSDELAEIELMVTHWNGSRQQQLPMTVRVDAMSEKTVELELQSGSLKSKK